MWLISNEVIPIMAQVNAVLKKNTINYTAFTDIAP